MTFVFWHITPKRNSRYDNVSVQHKTQPSEKFLHQYRQNIKWITMKNLLILSVLTFGVFLSGCEKDDDKIIKENFKFEATVLNKGLDCGETFIISLKNFETSSEFEDGIYYADNLDPEFKEQGLKIYLNCRQPNDDEVYACTTLGPTYPHLVVINSSIAEE